ncbi:competence type IV pilus ATPase ComGA [Rossellomorea sp. KS-H15a]|uniref:competence type IV pilus ATPase ComGA n=1 Tax=Rossellomorea sp. KS-H15a TaxID=2963940 RepID=UPI0020C6BC2A|nr:competence type IV pilus ATPase ComGA [Rossellomorea sp. KS-H15a]UTE76318.1 GspE/PulE family protein [Rossellomorea sp. KS-H15a]
MSYIYFKKTERWCQSIFHSVESLSEVMIGEAFSNDATDVHLIPRTKDYLIQFRKLGVLVPFQTIDPDQADRLIAHLKFMASMDIGEKRKPQSGSFSLTVRNTPLSLRISTLPTTHLKESLVIRILPQKYQIPIEKMSLYPSSAKKLLALLMHSHGLILFTGPTGSGKTTTLYSLVHHCSVALNRNVITLEDPVEKQHDEMVQIQVNEKAGITYSTGLKAILRHDPDIIMVGEIRDRETAEIAIRASLTGHLVISTLHTRDAKGAIYRLMELGIEWHDIEQTLLAVSAQRLLKLLCPICKAECGGKCLVGKNRNRASVYEIITGSSLKEVLKEAKGERAEHQYRTLQALICKGVALGFVSEHEYRKWVHEEKR